MNHTAISTICPIATLLCLLLLANSASAAPGDEPSKQGSDKQVISDSIVEKLVGIEGMATNSKETNQLAQAIFEAIGDPATDLQPSELFDGSKSTTDRRTKDILFVYGLMLLALKDQGVDAFELLQEYQPRLTYMDELPATYTGVLAFTYGWLINNTEVTVPCWFIREHTEVFNHHTPFWGATRDAYFSVCIPQSCEPETIPGYKELLSALEDADNPGGCWLGSIAYGRHKSTALEVALIANRPDYYLEHAQWNERANWLDYWQYLGPYNYRVAARIRQAIDTAKPALADMLLTVGARDNKAAASLAAIFLNNLVANKIGWSYEPYAANKQAYTRYGLSYWEAPPDSEFAAEILGGYILRNRPPLEFKRYVGWLLDHNRQEVIHSLMNFAAADNATALRWLLELDLPLPARWGAFNKSPLMYAVQYNNHASYRLLHAIAAMDTVTTPDEDGWDCEVPSICRRTVLTYAAENADAELLLQVIHDFGSKYGSTVDSDGRGFEDYLAKNAQLSEKEKARMRSTLALAAKMTAQGGE